MSAEQDLNDDTEWERIQASPEFVELRRRLRSFVFPVLALFLLWYLLYVLLADYAHEFMATKVFRNITVGLVQFVSTFLITWLYVRYANRKLDPVADELRAKIERGER